jgi:hypothetical protein
LPNLDVLAAEIVDDFQTALAQFEEILEELEEELKSTCISQSGVIKDVTSRFKTDQGELFKGINSKN